MEGGIFRDREESGKLLARKLGHYKDKGGVLVIGLPRGGVVVAYEAAKALNVPLEVLILRKLGVPWQPELAMGAVSETGEVVLNENIISAYGIQKDELGKEIERQKKEIARRKYLLRGGKGLPSLKGKTVILIDDGVATGATIKAAIEAVRAAQAGRLVVAVPVAPPETALELEAVSDEFICLEVPPMLLSIGSHYRNFEQVEDETVAKLLKKSRPGDSPANAGSQETAEGGPVRISAGRVELNGELTMPGKAGAVIIFAHGSGSSRLSPRNRYVARYLNQKGFATLLFDLLTPEEDAAYERRFDIDLLTRRLSAATKWLMEQKAARDLSIGYFGASTGSAAALKAATGLKGLVKAIVSRGGRPDMATEQLSNVDCPVLLIVGGDDRTVLTLNRQALALIRSEKKLAVVPGATHLFEEPGVLEEVAKLAAGWFEAHILKKIAVH
ncbi:MAG: phosphoribosyltransferase family protein [Actinomycetota bacterium]|nr:phosphoribosyltransferase family protein [Actinomycetota bacterium]